MCYFGETNAEDCGMCDVCIEHKSSQPSAQVLTHAQQMILDLLDDGEYHSITELKALNLPTRAFDNALQELINEEIVHVQGIMIWKSR